MIIAYEDSVMHLCPVPGGGVPLPPEGFLPMADDDLDCCFATLVEGHDVWVRLAHGARRLYAYLVARFRYVKAAGGVVRNPAGDCLMIARGGRWDLPKGMVEPGETYRQAACREVEEETGVAVERVGRLMAKSYHIYDKYGGWHLKQTSWFAMEAGCQAPRPQTEEGIAEAVWVPWEVCCGRLAGSYASLRELRIES